MAYENGAGAAAGGLWFSSAVLHENRSVEILKHRLNASHELTRCRLRDVMMNAASRMGDAASCAASWTLEILPRAA